MSTYFFPSPKSSVLGDSEMDGDEFASSTLNFYFKVLWDNCLTGSYLTMRTRSGDYPRKYSRIRMWS